MVFKWTQALSVGVDQIDDQHKELFARVNKLMDAIKSNSDKNVTAEVMEFLEKYVEVHFALEETYMERYDYYEEEKIVHEKEHEIFRQNFAELKKEFVKSGASKSFNQKLQDHVCSWLLNHISKVDTKLGQFL
ncbi:MAG: hemerythrin family protein [Nitrospirae bacterium]|nr:hemerythrin family protein [Nitrospirota bacterium]